MIYQYHAINIKPRDDLRDIGPGKYNYYSIYCIYPASYENLANVAKSFPWGYSWGYSRAYWRKIVPWDTHGIGHVKSSHKWPMGSLLHQHLSNPRAIVGRAEGRQIHHQRIAT